MFKTQQARASHCEVYCYSIILSNKSLTIFDMDFFNLRPWEEGGGGGQA